MYGRISNVIAAILLLVLVYIIFIRLNMIKNEES